ncbi:MAG: TldD/PmbA family protein [Candidatus Izemoplasmataceae bacterium]
MDFKTLFDKADQKGLEALQLRYSKSRSVELQVFKGELDTHEIADSVQLVIEGVYNGKKAGLMTEDPDLDQAEAWVDALIENAKVIESDDPVIIYEGDASYQKAEGVYNPALDDMTLEDKKAMVFDLERRVRESDARIDISEAFYSQTERTVHLENSKGLSLEKHINHAVLGAHIVVKADGDSRSAFDYIQTNDPDEFKYDDLVGSVVERGVSMLWARPVESGQYDVLIENKASAALLGAFLPMFKAEAIQKGQSKLKGKLGLEIASPSLNLIDDPFMEKSPKSGGFDDEGVATQKKPIIHQGKLSTYLHNLKTAKKDGTVSTGNGFSSGIAHTNLYIEPKGKGFETLVQEVKNGLLITGFQGLHSGTSPISGDFSLQASGYVIREGVLSEPVSLITVSSNFLELLQSVAAIGNDLKFNFAFIGSPTIRIDKMSISGT